MGEDSIVQVAMLSVQFCTVEDAGQQHVVDEVFSSLQVAVDVGQGGSECLQYHCPVLLTNDLISSTAGGEDGLLADGLHLRQDPSALCLQD